MDVLDKFLHSIAYKFPKGYPDMKDNQDILMLENLLKEKFDIILEAVNITDVLHETFFALAFESLINGKKYQIPKNLEELKTQLDNATKLSELKPGVTKETILDRLLNKKTTKQYFEDSDNKEQSPFSNALIDDAEDAKLSAEKTYDAIKKSYPKGKIESVKRVASDENIGVADNVVIVDGDPILISLKKGAGQFGSLSMEQLLNTMYGEGTLTGGLLTSIDQTGVNESLQGFIKDINDQIDEYTDKKTDTFTDPQLAAAMESDGSIGKKTNEDISTPSKWNNSKSKAKGNETTDTWFARGGKLKNIYGKLYELGSIKKGNINVENNHKKRKREKLNPSIDKYLESKGEIAKDNIAKLVSYLLRQDNEQLKNRDYLYVSNKGDKILKIPSRDKIFNKAEKLKIELDPIKSNISDYSRDLKILGDGKLLATIPLKFRFSGGQFRDLLFQKGGAPSFEEGFTEYFDALGDEITITT